MHGLKEMKKKTLFKIQQDFGFVNSIPWIFNTYRIEMVTFASITCSSVRIFKCMTIQTSFRHDQLEFDLTYELVIQ